MCIHYQHSINTFTLCICYMHSLYAFTMSTHSIPYRLTICIHFTHSLYTQYALTIHIYYMHSLYAFTIIIHSMHSLYAFTLCIHSMRSLHAFILCIPLIHSLYAFTKWVIMCKKIVTQSMSYFLNLCDCSVPYCASLEAWNWVVAGQHLNASHPRSSVWPNPNISIFSGFFLTNFKLSLLLNH